MKDIGINIKKNREEKGITLRALAKRLDLSASFLSQIETTKATPSLVTLKNIADALQTTIGSLVGEDQQGPDKPIVKEKDRKSITHIGSGIKMFVLTRPNANNQMEPLLFKLEPNANSGDERYRHFGQEFVLVLKGSMEIILKDKRHFLEKGDSIYFNSNTPHSFKNLSKGSTEVLWVITPPSF